MATPAEKLAEALDALHTLEKASVGQNIKPFATFLERLLIQSMKSKPIAKI